jgi:hypothetical protein
MSVVYVFGAGASKHVGYPLASEMGGLLLDYMLTSNDMESRARAEFLVDTFGRQTNFEDLLTELMERTDALKDSPNPEERSHRMRLGNSRGRSVDCLRQWFREIHLNAAPLYADFARRIVQPGDVVIMFNYDDSLERELRLVKKWDVTCGYGFQLGDQESPSAVLMLKLHGSINWLVSLFAGATGGTFIVDPGSSMGDRPVMHQSDLEFLGFTDFRGSTYKAGSAFPCLILPGRRKQLFYDTSLGKEFEPFWDHLWAQATNALRACEKVVICGYSLLPVDERACHLLTQGPKKQTHVEIVSGTQTSRIANDFRNSGFRNVAGFSNGYFNDWLASQLPEQRA